MATSARSSVWKKLMVPLATLGVIALAWYFWSRRSSGAPEFSTTAVAHGDVVQVVTATGDIEPVLDVNVGCQISGIISKLYVDWNSPVKAGQLIAQIDPATYQATVLQAEGQLANAKANYELTRVNTERTRELFKKSLVAQSDLDTAEAQLLQADAQVKIQSAALEMANVNLARCNIFSPIDGVVISRQVDVGNTVAASLSAPTLFMIANDLTKMQIIGAVAEADIGNVKVGQAVNFTVDAFPNQQFHGRVSLIRNAPQTQQNVVVYQTIIDVDNPDLKLRPGMTANVSIVIAERLNGLRLANSALRVRLPEELLPKAAPAPAPDPRSGAAAPAAKPLTDDERRAAIRQIMQEAGFTRGSGPPAAEVIQKAQQLAKERGLDIDFSRFGGGRGNGGSVVTARTVYKLVEAAPMTAKIQPVNVRLGITDGINTEVVDGLKDGDLVVTGVTMPGTSSAAAVRPASNPFAGGPGGFRR
ncbi:MAG TPA: efflux RND transporter periplasmic adaptor subunit [Opitutaceae bacterium]|nr:efflux RND transporter periplasmic adaptor subunit [Opitutaceae bacterium]